GDLPAVDRALHAAGQPDLAFREGRVEAWAGGGGPVAEAVVAGPEPDARGGLLVRVVPSCAPVRPAPRPDGRDRPLTRHLLRRQRLPLDRPEPGRGRLEALAAALTRLGLESEHDPDLRR